VRHRVRRVALVEDGQLALARGILQVEVEVGQPGAGHQALVDDGATRARWDVHPDAFAGRTKLGPASRQIKASFPFVGVEARAGAFTPRAMASWPRSGVATKPIPHAARASGRSPAQARRVEDNVGGTDREVIGIGRTRLVHW